MRPAALQIGPYAAGNATLLAASQAVVSGTALTLTGSNPDVARRVILTAGSEAAQRTLELFGTDRSGNTISEIMIVPATSAGTITSALDYATLTNALPAGGGWSADASLGTASSGTVGSSPWFRCDDWGFAPIQMQIDITGTITGTVEYSSDDPNVTYPASSIIKPYQMSWLPHPVLQNVNAPASGTFDVRPKFVRFTCTSFTAGTGNYGILNISQPGGKYG